MAGPDSERSSSLRARMFAQAAGRAVGWNSPQDLSRRSFEQLFQQFEPGRVVASSGQARLSGQGVTNSAAPIDSVGTVMVTLQKLVAATGAATQQFKNLR